MITRLIVWFISIMIGDDCIWYEPKSILKKGKDNPYVK